MLGALSFRGIFCPVSLSIGRALSSMQLGTNRSLRVAASTEDEQALRCCGRSPKGADNAQQLDACRSSLSEKVLRCPLHSPSEVWAEEIDSPSLLHGRSGAGLAHPNHLQQHRPGNQGAPDCRGQCSMLPSFS